MIEMAAARVWERFPTVENGKRQKQSMDDRGDDVSRCAIRVSLGSAKWRQRAEAGP